MSLAWNGDWTTQVDNDMLNVVDPCAINMFASALVERLYGAGLFGMDLYTGDAPKLGTDGNGGAIAVSDWGTTNGTSQGGIGALATGTSLGFSGYAMWSRLMVLTQRIAPYFVKGSPEASLGIDSWLFAYDETYGGNQRPILFPPTTGWYRAWPREIPHLDWPGADGQRARFTARISSPFYGVSATDPNFGGGSYVPTPSDQYKFSGLMMEWAADADGAGGHDPLGGSPGWVISADQRSSPDFMEEDLDAYQASVGYSEIIAPFPGDYISGAWLNRLRDAINLLTVTIIGSNGAIGIPEISSFTAAVTGGITIYTAAFQQKNAETMAGDLACKAAYTASFSSGGPLVATLSMVAFAAHNITNGSEEWWQLDALNASIANYEVLPNSPTPMTRAASFWAHTKAIAAFSDVSPGPYSAQGSGAVEDCWHQFDSTTTSATGSYAVVSGLWPGSLGMPGPAFDPTDNTTGFATDRVAILLDWAVTDGFVYTA